jgi:hypothetical protein
MSKSDLVNDKSLFGSLSFHVSEVEDALLELDSRKSSGFDDFPSLMLQNCASAFELHLCMLFNRALATCVFPDE